MKINLRLLTFYIFSLLFLILLILGTRLSVYFGATILVLYPFLIKEANHVVSILSVFLGALSLIFEIFLNKQYYFLSFVLFFLIMLIIMSFLISRLKGDMNTMLFIVMHIAFAIILSPIIKGFFTDLTNGNISTLGYFITVLFFFYLIILYYLIIKKIFSLSFIPEKLRCKQNLFYFSLAAIILILIGGYFYIFEHSEDRVRDFLIMISLVTTYGIYAYKERK